MEEVETSQRRARCICCEENKPTSSERKPRLDFVGHILAHKNTKGGLSGEEIVSNASTLILAGADTIVPTVAGTLSLLIQNPSAMQRVRDEIRSALLKQTRYNFRSWTGLNTYPQSFRSPCASIHPPSTGKYV